jgi:protein-disulfide isomerase
MRKKLLSSLALLGLLALPAASFADDQRKALILSNLEALFPQLAQMKPVMNEIKSSGIAGLDEGSFTIGQQTQLFHVTSDNKKLWMIGGPPFDVSKTPAEIAAAKADQAKKEAQAAETRGAELEKAVAGLPFRGKADAPVTIVEFSDFQCPYCSRGADLVEQLLAKYPNDLKFVFKHRPLEDIHPWALPAAIAASCAADQKPEAFWTLHDAYFDNQKTLTAENLSAKTREFLGGTGIDLQKFASCSEDPNSEGYRKAAAQIAADMDLGSKVGAGGTPAFFVDGQFVNGIAPLEHFETLIAQAKSGKGAKGG